MLNQKLLKRKVLHEEVSDVWKEIEGNSRFNDSIEAAQLDLIVDLDEEFFNISYDLVQQLVPLNSFVAGKMKLFVDIVGRLHEHYVKKVKVVQDLEDTVNAANERLKLALEVSAESSFVMKELRVALEEAWRTTDASEYRESLLTEHNIDYESKYGQSPTQSYSNLSQP